MEVVVADNETLHENLQKIEGSVLKTGQEIDDILKEKLSEQKKNVQEDIQHWFSYLKKICKNSPSLSSVTEKYEEFVQMLLQIQQNENAKIRLRLEKELANSKQENHLLKHLLTKNQPKEESKTEKENEVCCHKYLENHDKKTQNAEITNSAF